MPELPEVETVRRTLQTQILNKKITNVFIRYSNIIENVSEDKFINCLKGQTIRDIERYGKYLIFILDNYSLISHLRMEGKYFLKNINDEYSVHEHIIFILDDKISFRYHDTRKFGKMVLLNTTDINEIMKYPALKKLAKEANDPTFSSNDLYNILKNKSIPIKSALLDQTIICGLGNIYVDEVCYLAKLNPKMLSKKITLKDCENILEASKVVLKKAIEKGGTTIRSYTSSLGVTGLFQLELLVHSKENEPCPGCGNKIIKEFVGGRGTYYCTICQKNRLPKVVGITGSIASGKTSITNYLKEKGYEVIDADEIVSKHKEKNKLIYDALVKEFGRKILNNNNEIDNKILSQIIYENPNLRIRVNNIVHPIVYSICEKQIKNTSSEVIFLSVPLLYEAGFEKLCDVVICVNIKEEIQIERLMKRSNISKEEAQKRISAQMPLKEKCEKATFIIDNSNDLCYTIKKLEEILNEIGE